MRSIDYLYSILKKHPNDGYVIGNKRYTIGTQPLGGGKWQDAVCTLRYEQCRVVGEFKPTSEEAWESFLSDKYPKVLEKWKKREAEAA